MINKHKADSNRKSLRGNGNETTTASTGSTITRKYSSITYKHNSYNVKKTVERRICFNIPENQWIRGKTTTTRGPYGKTTNRKKTWKPANQGSPTKEHLHSKGTLHFTGTPTTQTQGPGKNLQPKKNRQYSRTVHQGKLRPREILLFQQEKLRIRTTMIFLPNTWMALALKEHPTTSIHNLRKRTTT